ncbi:MAG: hypothetical protein VKN72_25300 [Nostocales cyanobacterium 94392]|nr:hypothetical protein [Nostocales cyanobacterium 94392]
MTESRNQQLPQEIIKPIKSKQFVLSLLGSFIFLILFNFAAKLYLKENTTNRAYWLINEKWEILFRQKKPVDWLILGDSSCNQGVVPSILNTRLNVSSINLCTIGDMLSLDDAWMLEKYIQRFGVPKNVLIVHVYDAWNREVNHSLLAKLPLNWGYWQQLEPNINLGLKDTAQLFIERYIPLYSENQSISHLLKYPGDAFNRNQSFRLEEDGLMIWEKPNPEYVEAQKKMHLDFVAKNQFNLSTTNRRALEHIAALAEKHNFNVYLANSPIYERLYEHQDFQAYFTNLQNTLDDYAAKSDRVYYIREPITFSKEQMENADHLIYSAAKVYTNKLITEIESIQEAKD